MNAPFSADWQGAAELLGGNRALGRNIEGPLDAHELLVQGLPWQAVSSLVESLTVMGFGSPLASAIGISLRTYQRHKDAPKEALTAEQGSRTWKFAEILAQATLVLGSQEEAERWLLRPAMGLNQHRPIDLLATAAGTEAVEQFLGRLKYGVYS